MPAVLGIDYDLIAASDSMERVFALSDSDVDNNEGFEFRFEEDAEDVGVWAVRSSEAESQCDPLTDQWSRIELEPYGAAVALLRR